VTRRDLLFAPSSRLPCCVRTPHCTARRHAVEQTPRCARIISRGSLRSRRAAHAISTRLLLPRCLCCCRAINAWRTAAQAPLTAPLFLPRAVSAPLRTAREITHAAHARGISARASRCVTHRLSYVIFRTLRSLCLAAYTLRCLGIAVMMRARLALFPFAGVFLAAHACTRAYCGAWRAALRRQCRSLQLYRRNPHRLRAAHLNKWRRRRTVCCAGAARAGAAA